MLAHDHVHAMQLRVGQLIQANLAVPTLARPHHSRETLDILRLQICSSLDQVEGDLLVI